MKVFAMDETGVSFAGEEAYLFVAYEPFVNRILGLYLAWTPNSVLIEMFLQDLVRKYGRHQVWTDGAESYALACHSIGLKHHIHSDGSWLWKVIERQMEKLKDRTESFDDLFPCRNHGLKCNFKHIQNWVNAFLLHQQPEYQLFTQRIKEVLLS